MLELFAFIFGIFAWKKPEYFVRKDLPTREQRIISTRNLGRLLTIAMGALLIIELIQYFTL